MEEQRNLSSRGNSIQFLVLFDWAMLRFIHSVETTDYASGFLRRGFHEPKIIHAIIHNCAV